jgi:transportin-3
MIPPQELPAPSDNVDEELVRILEVLRVIYSPLNSNEGWSRQLADRYLVRFQSTPIAWVVCDRLLHNADPQARFFAAQTIHHKCQCDIHQLPVSSLPSLKDSLMLQLHQAEHGSFKTQLALSIAALAIQMSWTTVMQDLASSPHALLVFQVLPEECSSTRIILEDECLRFIMEDALLSNARQVLEYSSFDLWLSWIRYLPIPAEVIVEANIVPICLHNIHDNEVAVDVLVEMIRMYPSHGPHNKSLVQSILPSVMSLPLDQVLAGDDDDVKLSYCRIFTEVGESYLSILLEQDGQSILTKVTQCTSIPDNSISGMTHNFWYRFVMELEHMDDYRKRQNQVDLYTPHLRNLLDVCLIHMEYPSNGELSEESIDDFHKERFSLSETTEDCCRLLGGNSVLERIGARLASAQSNWISIEACLYAMQPLAKYIPHDENDFMPRCFTLLQQLPTNIEPLRYTASMFIGKYAAWLATHSDHLRPILPYLAQSLWMPKCAHAAAMAIKSLCEFIPLGEPVFELYGEICGRIELGNELEILDGLCKCIEENLAPMYLPKIIQPIGSRLQASLQNPSSKDLQTELDRITVVLRYLRLDPLTMVGILQTSWTMLECAGKMFSNEIIVAEKLCRLHKHTLRRCGSENYAPILPSLMTTIVNLFQCSHQAPYLYLASIVGSEFPGHPELFNMIEILCQTAFGILTNKSAMISQPDVVEELFYFIGRMLQNCPQQVLAGTSERAQNMFCRLIECALLALEVDHRDANRGTLHFLQQWVSVHREGTLLFQRYGSDVVNQLIRSLRGDLPLYCLDRGNGSVSGVLFHLKVACAVEFQSWLSVALQGIPDRISRDFENAVNRQKDRNDFDVVVRTFKIALERYRKMSRLN